AAERDFKEGLVRAVARPGAAAGRNSIPDYAVKRLFVRSWTRVRFPPPPSNGLVKPKDNAAAAIGSSSSRPTRRRSARFRSVRPDRPKRGYRLCRLDVRVV